MANHRTQPDLHKVVDESLHLTTLQRTRQTWTATSVCDCLIGESGPFPHPFRHGWLPTSHSYTGCHHLSISQTKPRYPIPAQRGQQYTDETNNRRSDLDPTSKAKYTHITPPSQQQPSSMQSSNTNTRAKRSKPTKGSYIIRKQTTNPDSLTKKINTLAAVVRMISNVVYALQPQVCTLSTENLMLKTVIRNLKKKAIDIIIQTYTRMLL